MVFHINLQAFNVIFIIKLIDVSLLLELFLKIFKNHFSAGSQALISQRATIYPSASRRVKKIV